MPDSNVSGVADLNDDRHRRVSGGAAGEQAEAAASDHQLLDQLDPGEEETR